MSKWGMVKLGDVCDVVSGFAFDSRKFTDDSTAMPIIRIRDVVRGFTATYTTEKYDKKFVVKKGDLLIGMDGEFNIAEWKDEPALLNQRVCKIFAGNESIFEKYLLYFMPAALKRIEDKTPFVTVKHISIKQIKEILIPLPSIEEQKRIADVLDKASNLIDLRKQQIEKMDLLIKSKFIDMFGNPVTNPKGWEVACMGKLGELNRGISKFRPRNAPELLGGKYPLIQTGEVASANLYIETFEKTYSELGLKQSKLWPKGTLCITIAANIAKTSILNFDACFPDSVVGFISNNQTNHIFIHYWFSFFQEILEKQAPESAQKNINLKILNELEVIVPPVSLQNQFAVFVEQIEKQKAVMQQSLEKMETNYKALMQKYFG